MRFLPIILVALFCVSCPKGASQEAASPTKPTKQAKPAVSDARPYAGMVTAWADPLLLVPLEAVGAELEKWYGIELELTPVDRGELFERVETGKLDNLPDVFLVGHPDLFMALREAGLIDEQDARTFAGDRLVVVQKRGTGLRVRDLFEMYKLYFEAFGLGEDTTTAGFYGYQALLTCGVHKRIEDRLVLLPSTQAIIDSVEAGEVELAIMAVSTATQTPSLEVLHIVDETFHEDIRYLAIPARGTSANPTVTEFLRLLAEDAGVQHSLMGYGLLDRATALEETK